MSRASRVLAISLVLSGCRFSLPGTNDASVIAVAPDAGTQPTAAQLAEVRRSATGIVVTGAQLVAVKTALDAFKLVLGPEERLEDFELTSYKRGPQWVVLFGPADLTTAGGGIEYTIDANGERVVETVGGP